MGEGYHLQNAKDLYSLCKVVLLKPGHDESAFQQLFDQYLLEVKAIAKKAAAENLTKDKDPSKAGQPDTTETSNRADQPTQTTPPPKTTPPSVSNSVEASSISENAATISLFFADGDAVMEGISMETEKQGMDEIIFQKAFIIKGDDYLLPGRILKQAWRSMRSLQEVGSKHVLDVDQTVQAVAKRGFLDQPVFKAAYQNTTRLTILVDASASMVAFGNLGQKMIQTAQQDRHFQNLQVFYFNNVPEDYLFHDERMTDPIEIADFLMLPKTPVLIFSDAGAARGLLNWERASETIDFLKLLGAPKWTWINPMPRERWLTTTAELIAEQSKHMFECNTLEFRNAIKMLRGKVR